MQAVKKLQKDCTKEVNFPLQTEIIYRKSHSETHSHGTFMESHHNHHETDSTQPFTSDIDNLKGIRYF